MCAFQVGPSAMPGRCFVETRVRVHAAVGSHDTASAVVAVPATGEDFAHVSSGMWGLVGLELKDPVLTEEAGTAGFTNEGGVDGRTRILRSVMRGVFDVKDADFLAPGDVPRAWRS